MEFRLNWKNSRRHLTEQSSEFHSKSKSSKFGAIDDARVTFESGRFDSLQFIGSLKQTVYVSMTVSCL